MNRSRGGSSANRWLSSIVEHKEVEKTPITAKLWELRKQQLQMETLKGGSGSVRSEPRIMDKGVSDSRVEMTYRFGSDLVLKDLYLDSGGNVLIGKLFEDLDSLAGTVAFLHSQDDSPDTPPAQLVTASCEAITLRRPIPTSKDIVLVGQVGWVGKSSLDVIVEVHERRGTEPVSTLLGSASPTLLLSSVFTYVSRNRATGKPLAVNRLVLEPLPSPGSTATTHPKAGTGSTSTVKIGLGLELEAQRSFQRQREAAAVARKAMSAMSSLSPAPAAAKPTPTTPPTPTPTSASASSIDPAPARDRERDRERALIEAGRCLQDLPALAAPHTILMSQSQMDHSFICHPQNTNTAGRVFGGFLMHRAYDIAESCAYQFGGKLPSLISCDRILFKRAVEIGDLVRLRARVCASATGSGTAAAGTSGAGAALDSSFVVVDVVAHVVQPSASPPSSHESNTFTFIFGFPTPSVSTGSTARQSAQQIRAVLPRSPEEATTIRRAEDRLSSLLREREEDQ